MKGKFSGQVVLWRLPEKEKVGMEALLDLLTSSSANVAFEISKDLACGSTFTSTGTSTINSISDVNSRFIRPLSQTAISR